MSENFPKITNESQKAISEDLKKTYSEQIIEHFTQPKNVGKMTDPDGSAIVKGQCGDTMEMYLKSLFFKSCTRINENIADRNNSKKESRKT